MSQIPNQVTAAKTEDIQFIWEGVWGTKGTIKVQIEIIANPPESVFSQQAQAQHIELFVLVQVRAQQ